jgi:predicted ATPase/class 3 adenylate cyclase
MTKQVFPSGRITFLFTDLEGSTGLWEKYPEAMKSALARHDAILKSAVVTNGGIIVKTTGDGLHAAFSSAAEAVNSVITAQLDLISEPWEQAGPLRVRMALHTGEADFRDGDYYGSVVNRSARIMGVAAGEQILISGSTADLVNNRLPEGISLLDLGKHHLRGLKRPERLYQLLHPELRDEFPSIKTQGTVANNLPAEMTSFVGRTNEFKQLGQILGSGEPHARLITLTGPGGTGKTRLALHYAAQTIDQFLDGIWLVELAQVTVPEQIAQAVATPIGLREQPERSLDLILVDHLRSQRALIILDNCEHLTEECARLAEILIQQCPNLRILATSRETLGIPGERTMRVSSLTLPGRNEAVSIDNYTEYDSINLFLERARTANPDFIIDQGNVEEISQICQRLDGIPLAIELAAARVRMLTPVQIASRLDDRFRLLTGGSRTALPRQRTLKALIDWSYELLPDNERILLNRLSVFSGGWVLEAAEHVGGIEPILPDEVLDLLEQLVNKSLVIVEDTELGIRYHMLESIRHYAQERLSEIGDSELFRMQHASYYQYQSRKSYNHLLELRPPGDWVIMFRPEADNFRSAWSWSLENDLWIALEFAGTFSLDWSQVVPLIEIHRYQLNVFDLVGNDPNFTGAEADIDSKRILSNALISASRLAFIARNLPLAKEYAERSASIADDIGDSGASAWARSLITTAAGFSSGTEALNRWLTEDYPRVMQYGRNFTKATSLVRWGTFQFFATGRYDQESRDRWNQGFAMLQHSGNLWLQGNALQIAADLSSSRGNIEQAERLARQVLDIYMDIGDIYAANPARSLLADIAREKGEYDRALNLYRETIQVWRDTGSAQSGVRTIESLAFTVHGIAKRKQGHERLLYLVYAVKLLGAAGAVRDTLNLPVNIVDQADYERELFEIELAVGNQTFQSAWEVGQEMEFDQVILMTREDPQ